MPFIFTRASEHGPDVIYPPIDDRGHGHPTFGPILPMQVIQEEARVRIVSQLEGRRRIGLTTTDDSFRILSDAEVDIDGYTDVQLSAWVGGASDGALEVHAGGVHGPVVARLTVRVFDLQVLICALHVVQLVNNTGSRDPPDVAGLDVAFSVAANIWAPYGIWILPPSMTNLRVVQARSSDIDALQVPDNFPSRNVNNVLNSAHTTGALNVYLVRAMSGGILGIGTLPSWVQARLVSRRGLLLAGSANSDRLGRTLAHEIGHVLGLAHVRDMQAPNADGTTFALRQLMHNFSPPAAPTDWPPGPGGSARTTTRPRFGDVGWEAGRKGGLITLKTLPHVRPDNQAHTANTHLRRNPF